MLMQSSKQMGKQAPQSKVPTRRSPRIGTEGYTRYGREKQNPVQSGLILNVSERGVQLFVDAELPLNTILQIEVGDPIFSPPQLVKGKVRHIQPAPKAVEEMMRQQGKLRTRAKGYLLGVELVQLDAEQQRILKNFVKEHTLEEQKRRGESSESSQMRSAYDRVYQQHKTQVPRWIYAAALLSGAYMIAMGIMQGRDNLTVAIQTSAVLIGCWVVGQIGSNVWAWLEVNTGNNAVIVATMDGDTTAGDDTIADADSQLDLPPTQDRANTSGTETPRSTTPTSTEGALTALAA